MQIDNLLVEMESNLENYNNVKEVVLLRLLADKVITDEQFKHYTENWNVIIIKPSWFKRWKNKFSDDKNGYVLKFVKFED